MWSLASGGRGGGGGLGADVGWLAVALCWVGLWSLEELHAAIDSAVTPASSEITKPAPDVPDAVAVMEAFLVASVTAG